MKRTVVTAVLGVMALLGCAQDVPPRPMVEVVVDEVVLEPYQPRYRYVGRLQAQDDVAIQARVTGYLVSRDFREGELVAAGDVLYTLDASEYDAALARAKADLASSVANQSNAERNFRRGQELAPKGAISISELDTLKTKKLEADAHIESAKAQVSSAQVNLGYTSIIAPIAGRIGRSAVTVGDLVGPTSGDLTSLVSIDPIDAMFQVSESTYVSSISQNLIRGRDISALRRIEVTLELTTGVVHPEVGSIDYLANRVDQSTGTLEARAKIPNSNSLLVPGQYVRIILRDTQLIEGLFVPQAAIQADQQGSFVLTVEEGDTIVRRNVVLGDRRDDKVVVKSGVEAGDRVVVRGLQQVRPGMSVKTKTLSPSEQQG